jgi:hypothetical protein
MKLFIKTVMASSIALSAYAYESQRGTVAPTQSLDPNPSARWGTRGNYNWYLDTDFVYFRPESTIYPIDLLSTQTNPVTNQEMTNYISFQQSFNPGVRAILGCNTSFGGWDLFASYFGYFYDKSQRFVNLQMPGYDSSNVQRQSSGYSTLGLNYNINQGDLNLGRSFLVSKELKIRPYTNIRALWFNQKLLVDNNSIGYPLPPPSATITSTQNNDSQNGTIEVASTLAGINLGTNLHWLFTKRVSLYTSLGAGLLFMTQNTSHEIASSDVLITQSPSGSVANSKFTDSRTTWSTKNDVIPDIDIEIGLQWDRNFYDDRFHIGLKLGYELHSLIGINDIYEASPQITSNFSLHGLVTGFRFDF